MSAGSRKCSLKVTKSESTQATGDSGKERPEENGRTFALKRLNLQKL